VNGSEPLQTHGSARRRIVGALTERLLLKLTAVLLAIILWFVVEKQEPQIELVPVRFQPVLLDSSLVLRDPLPQFEAIVAGAPKELIKLNSSLPFIRRQITGDAPDTLVLDLRPADVILPDGIDAVVRDVQPRSLTLRFEPTRTRTVRIDSSGLDIVAPPGSGAVTPMFDPSMVQVSGPRHLVLAVRSVRTVRTTILLPDSLTHLVDIDTTLLGPGLRVRPAQVRVHVLAAAHPR
jgi:hypothetical protein